jgi:hypothetical protein
VAAYDSTYNVAIGPVLQNKIPYGDPYWSTFNASFENQSLTQTEVATSLYDGRPITTQHSDHWRHSRNYIMGQHLGIDFDTEDSHSSLPVLLKDPFIHKHASLLYTTPSHTPDKPRSRAIFLLNTPIKQPSNYVLAASALLWIFGTADRQCKDAVRFFYGGRPGACEMEWLGNELPLDIIKDLIKRYQTTGQQARKHLHTNYTPNGANETEVVDALKKIDAWSIGYDEWVDVLMAIHSEFPGANGESIAESWAQGKDGEVEQKWRSFNANGSTLGRVGIGTMFKMAIERGYKRECQA